jgi:hypothetical protein
VLDLDGECSGRIAEAPCNGQLTSRVTINAFLPSDAPLLSTPWATDDMTATASTSTTVYDSTARPYELTILFRHTGQAAWAYRLLLMIDGIAVDQGGGTRAFDELGHLLECSGQQDFRLPMPDGQIGPAIQLEMGAPQHRDGYLVESNAVGFMSGGAYPNGWPVNPTPCLIP